MRRIQASTAALPCMCASLRRAARAVTQSYDRALQPLGLRTTQFSILQVLSRTGELSQGEMARMLAMDSTTLTRTLELLRRRGLVAKHYGRDRRVRRLRLSKGGALLLKRATPHWEKVQARLARQLGDTAWAGLMALTTTVAAVAGDGGRSS